MSAAENRAAVEAAYAAIMGGDPRGFLAALHEDVVVVEPACLPHGGTHEGVAALGAMFAAAAKVLAPGRMELLEVTAEDDRVLALLRVGLTNGGSALVLERWILREGRATEIRVFWDDPTRAL